MIMICHNSINLCYSIFTLFIPLIITQLKKLLIKLIVGISLIYVFFSLIKSYFLLFIDIISLFNF